MAGSGISRADANKKVRQDALREQLSTQGHVQHIIDIADKLVDLTEDLDPTQVNRLKIVIDSKFKFLDKYLPSLKAIEVDGNVDTTFTVIRKEYTPSK